MNTLRCGYEPGTESALHELLGDRFFANELTVSRHRPIIEVPGPYETIEFRPIPRMAIVIEGDTEKLGPFLDAIREHLP